MRERNNTVPYNHLEIIRQIRTAGREIGPDAMAAMGLLANFHERPPYEGLRIERDVSYGPDARNRIDLCVSDDFRAGCRRDVLVFLHGGGFVRGDKRLPDSPYHDNVMVWAARQGLLGVNMTYRLAPQHEYPAGIEDVALAMQWMHRHLDSWGGDTNRIFLFGSSAGAIHVAGYLTDSGRADIVPAAGAVLQSGVYDLTVFTGEGNVGAYFGKDVTKYPERSPQAGLINGRTPVLYVLAQFDAPLIEMAHLSLINAYVAHWNTLPDFIRLIGHNHFTVVASLNSPDDCLGNAILAFMNGTRP
jgi:acetyl esterase/lipase